MLRGLDAAVAAGVPVRKRGRVIRWLSRRVCVGLAGIALPLLMYARDMSAQDSFGRIIRGNGEATLTVFDGRPLERAAQTLAHEFGVRISVEDPLYLWDGDLVDLPRSTTGQRTTAPKPLLLEASFALDSSGQPANMRSLLDSLIERVSLDRPFAYRVDAGPGGYTLVPTRMRNERGELVPYISPLDTVVTLPHTVRVVALHANAIREVVETRTGYHIACCTLRVSNVDLQTSVDFTVDRESARHALQRLMLLRPQPAVQHMRCQALTRTCFVEWTPLTQADPFPFPN